MKTNLIILIVIGLSSYLLTIHFSQKPTTKIKEVPNSSEVTKTITDEQTIPDFTFTDINGITQKVHDLKEKIIILNFWASWCTPCIKEFPDLVTIAKEHSEDVVLLALSSDINEKAINKFITKMDTKKGINFNANNIAIALDENQKITSGIFQTYKLPETLIIDKNLKIRHKLIGANWEKHDLTKIIKELQKE